MGGICSKRSTVDHAPSRSSRQPNGHEAHGSGKPSTKVVTQPPMGETMEKRGQESHLQGSFSFSTNQNNIEDGIPRFPRDMSHKSRSTKHRPAGGAKGRVESLFRGKLSVSNRWWDQNFFLKATEEKTISDAATMNYSSVYCCENIPRVACLDRFEQDYRRKLQEDDGACIAQKGMEKLVDIVHFLHLEIHERLALWYLFNP
ncbi:hypothetical protein GIB67_014440 [Kingdonia uniflora]|uniref:Uncharacterized protein n=1 Tax=Kingdonia uniflora TaxID=39325 RepID=A0A7J7LZ87_9MAGN|nr:hypothetical protein GIB67_014440 [Kingdonia uniflora]